MQCLTVLTLLVQAFLSKEVVAFSKDFTLGSYTPHAISVLSPNLVSTYVLLLGRKKGSKSANYLSVIRNNWQIDGWYKYGFPDLNRGFGDAEYTTEIFVR